MKNYIYNEFIEACLIEGISPSAWAERNGLGNSMPTNLKNGIRPSVETLVKLLNGFKESECGVRIIVAHLKDEAERAGVSLDKVKIRISSEAEVDSTLDDDLQTVQEYMNHRPIRESMHALAALLRVSEWSGTPQEIIAQGELDAAIHKAKRKTKTRTTNRGTA